MVSILNQEFRRDTPGWNIRGKINPVRKSKTLINKLPLQPHGKTPTIGPPKGGSVKACTVPVTASVCAKTELGIARIKNKIILMLLFIHFMAITIS